MKRIITILCMLFLPALCAAQEEKPFRDIYFSQATIDAADTKPCNAHQRKWYKPFSSNMCQEDYDKWVEPRRNDHWYKDKTFWLGVAVIGASIALDAHSTSHDLNVPGIIEKNPFLGPHPSNAKITGFSTLYFGAQFGFHVAAWKLSHNDPSKPWRTFGQWTVPASAVAINARQGVLNYRLREKVKPAGLLQ